MQAGCRPRAAFVLGGCEEEQLFPRTVLSSLPGKHCETMLLCFIAVWCYSHHGLLSPPPLTFPKMLSFTAEREERHISAIHLKKNLLKSCGRIRSVLFHTFPCFVHDEFDIMPFDDQLIIHFFFIYFYFFNRC